MASPLKTILAVKFRQALKGRQIQMCSEVLCFEQLHAATVGTESF
jgi:hypothetical protein